MSAFKRHLCSDRVLVPYDTRLNIRIYIASSHIGTQATVVQCHTINGEKFGDQSITPSGHGLQLKVAMVRLREKAMGF